MSSSILPYLTVKCPIQRVVKDNKMRDAIEHRVQFVSKMMHRGSHVVLLTAVHCYRADLPFPEIKSTRFASTFIKHCFNPFPRRVNGAWTTELVPHNVMDAIHDQLQWPSPTSNTIEDAGGDQPLLGYARHYSLHADQYATNLVNHITANVWRYINYTIISFCRSNGYPTSMKHPLVKELMAGIKDDSYIFAVTHVKHTVTNERIPVDQILRDEFIAYHRKYLDAKSIDLNGDEESGITIEEQAQKLVLYFVHLLKYQNTFVFNENDEIYAELFHPVPIHGMKRFHMDIDGEILYYLLKDCGIELAKRSPVDGGYINAPIYVRDGLHVRYFDEYFSVKQFETAPKTFNYSNGISTDNIAVSVLLKRDESVAPGVAQRRKKTFRLLSSELFS